MKLNELRLLEAKVAGWPTTKEEVRLRIEAELNGGITSYVINDNLSVTFKNSFSIGDNTLRSSAGPTRKYNTQSTFPFKMEHVQGDFRIDGMRKIVSLEGCPEDVQDSFMLDNAPLLKNLEHAPKHIGTNVRVVACNKLESLKGLPEKIYRDLTLAYLPALKSLEEFPSRINGKLSMQDLVGITSLVGIADHIKYLGRLRIHQGMNIEEGGIGLILIEGLTDVKLIKPSAKMKRAFDIISKYLGKHDEIFECQEELINAGLEEYSRL